MRILFLNQYFPPDPAPTGNLFAELADECRRKGHEVDFVDAGQDYRAGQNQCGRLKREMSALRRMAHEGKARQRPDVVISGSSPPCLAVFADRVARHHRAAHLHWAMDVYPEIAVALREIGSLVAKLAGWMMGSAYRRCKTVVALDDDMRAVLGRYGARTACIRPWVLKRQLEQIIGAPQGPPKLPFTWVYSGNLGRAHEYETLLMAQRILENERVDARLLFQGGGPAWERARKRAGELGLKYCEWRGYVPEDSLVESLLDCSVLIVTQRPETKGLLWPSKMGVVSAMQRPIVFVGPLRGAIALELGRLCGVGIFAQGDSLGIANWVAAERWENAANFLRIDPRAHRLAALEQWMQLIEQAR